MEQHKSLLARLVNCFVLLINRNETALVTRKFFSTMTGFFFKNDAPWKYCIRHIATSLAHAQYLPKENPQYLPEEDADQHGFETSILPSLSYERLLAVLSFSAALAEESLRYNTDGYVAPISMKIIFCPLTYLLELNPALASKQTCEMCSPWLTMALNAQSAILRPPQMKSYQGNRPILLKRPLQLYM